MKPELIIPIVLIGAVVCGFGASAARGSPTLKGFVWGFLFGPIGILIAAIIGVQDRLDLLHHPPTP